jgi:hypothetical protein
MESDSSTTIQPAGKGRRNKKRETKKFLFLFQPGIIIIIIVTEGHL